MKRKKERRPGKIPNKGPARPTIKTVLTKLSNKERELVGNFIAGRAHVAVQQYLTAGVTILEEKFGFTEEQRKSWLVSTMELGPKYLGIVTAQEENAQTSEQE